MAARHILLVEDNPADARLTIETFRRSPRQIQVEVCADGEGALTRLRAPGAVQPELILLDLNLPGIDGREVLEALKSDQALCRIPVCVLTTSRARTDVDLAYQKHSNCYVVKPVDLNAFRSAVEQIERFWFDTAQLPLFAAAQGAP